MGQEWENPRDVGAEEPELLNMKTRRPGCDLITLCMVSLKGVLNICSQKMRRMKKRPQNESRVNGCQVQECI